MIFILGMAALLQQGVFQGATSPASGDTIGYWQQHVHYTIVATLDEAQTKLHGRATLVYVNNSPNTLSEMYVHQYLNAFRPGSKWSAVDEHENRERFQNLEEPDYGYERFTTPPVVDGTPVFVDYPGQPDSTVAHFKLPAPLAPGDSVRVVFEWDARPSTVTRRQGRRGRTWDFAQWYPKVAVYDRRGWEPNPLVPAGELYGEYGTYDVTMVVKDDQILASTGVPVSGDPGWARVSRTGPPRLAADAYTDLPPAPAVTVPDGYRAVRFVAENVHHFAWSASPDYRYEGGIVVRSVPKQHFPTWDTISVHVLFKPADDTTWGGGRAVERTIFAAKWLESIWGPYAYPQITNVHRLDPGGTEFPMMVMNGSASQGLILHEFGHVFTYGILGNNEWRSGWLDEGLTDYQTDWAQNLSRPEQASRPPIPPLLPEGYRVNALTIPHYDSLGIAMWKMDLLGQAQAIGTPAYDFRDFGVYNEMIYDRAKLMYSQLRDVLGDSAFKAFFHDYYTRWALKHVDERAIRGSAERASYQNLGWFFDQWIRGTGIMDYAIGPVHVNTDGAKFETIARVKRQGELRHPMPVGVHTASGWTFARAEALADEQDVRIVTSERPDSVVLDPKHLTWDWDWRNNMQNGSFLVVSAPRVTFNWPYLNQSDRSHTTVAVSPTGWYSDPQAVVAGIRARTNYLSMVDLYDAGIGFATRNPRNATGDGPAFFTQFQGWARAENVYWRGMSRPAMGLGGGVNYLDGLFKADLFQDWDFSPFALVFGPTIKARTYLTAVLPTSSLLLPEQWTKTNVGEIGATGSYKTIVYADSSYTIGRASIGGGFSTSSANDRSAPSRGYFRGTASIGMVRSLSGPATQVRVRVFGGIARGAPAQRSVFASSQDPLETFNNDLFRARGALLKQDGINYLPLGGAGLRGFRYDLALDGVASVNAEFVQRLATVRGAWGRASFSLSLFGDVGVGSSQFIDLTNSSMSDAGAGIVTRGRLYDRDVYVRLDAPVFVNQAGLAGWRGLGNGSFAPRWTLTIGDLW
jgi:Peptidase family M1 domain